MKKRLDDLFDEASAKELDTLMENKSFSVPLDDAVLARIEKQTLEKSGLAAPRAKKRVVKRALLLAATFALLLAVTLGAVACAAEKKEYREALKFFEEHDLSTEGLSRGEIKAVYRDISLHRFTYSKTAEVIEKSVWAQRLEGVEILQNDPTPEEIEEIWKSLEKNMIDNTISQFGAISVEVDGGVRYEARMINAGEQYIDCYDGDQLRWSIQLEPEYRSLWEMYPLGDGLLAEYSCEADMNDKMSFGYRLVRINSQGEILWEYVIDRDYELGSIGCFDNNDGMISVLFWGAKYENGERNNYFIVKRFDKNGEVFISYRNKIGGRIKKACRRDGGYLLLVTDGFETYIVTTDISGRMIDQFGYSVGNKNYEICDVIEYGRKIYLSVNAVPKHDGYELKPVRDYAYKQWNKDDFSYTDKKLLQLFRDCYTATLMVCDPNDGVPKVFYSQKGAFAGKLSIDDAGTLVWDVKSIVSVEYTPYLSSSSFSGKCYVYQYAFDTDGKLLGQIQTERIEGYWK